jgi:hypothetical protein
MCLPDNWFAFYLKVDGVRGLWYLMTLQLESGCPARISRMNDGWREENGNILWSFSTRCASVSQAVVCLFEPESIGFLLLDVRLKDWSNTVLDYGKE